jgi:hypothetical protein
VKARDAALPVCAGLAALVGAPPPVVFGLAGGGVVLAAMAAARPILPVRRGRLRAAASAPPPAAPLPPRRLVEAQRLVLARGGTAGGVHHWLRPLLRDVVAERLARRHGVDLDDPRAAAHVPEPLWELVRPDRLAPADRNAPGTDLPTLTLAVDQASSL